MQAIFIRSIKDITNGGERGREKRIERREWREERGDEW
jgi:hypothetical protein